MTAPLSPPARNGQPLGPLLGGAVLLAVFLLLLSAAHRFHQPSMASAVHGLLDGDVNGAQRHRLTETVLRRGVAATPTDRGAAWRMWSAGLLLDDAPAVALAAERLGLRREGAARGLPILQEDRARNWAEDPQALRAAALGEPVVENLLRCALAATRGDGQAATQARQAAALSGELFRMSGPVLVAASDR